MPLAAFLLWSGSTLLTRRTSLTLSLTWTRSWLTLSHISTTKILISPLTPSVRISSYHKRRQHRLLCQIGARGRGSTLVKSGCWNTQSQSRNINNSSVQEAFKMKKFLIIGISGVTNGGKTSLCEKLEQDLPMATHINMDDYFHDPASGKIPFVEALNHGNYEDPRSINFSQMEKDVNEWVKQAAKKPSSHKPLLFLEGILIFNYKPLVPYYTLKYFLTLTKEQCWERRRHRRYDPPDPPNYFEMVVWPMYLKNKKALESQKDIIYIDGMDKLETTYKRVLSDLKVQLEEK